MQWEKRKTIEDYLCFKVLHVLKSSASDVSKIASRTALGAMFVCTESLFLAIQYSGVRCQDAVIASALIPQGTTKIKNPHLRVGALVRVLSKKLPLRISAVAYIAKRITALRRHRYPGLVSSH